METFDESMLHQLVNLGWAKESCFSAYTSLIQNGSTSPDINDMLEGLLALEHNYSHSTREDEYFSHNDLITFAYVRQIYEDTYNALVPLDIKLLCCSYNGYCLCCLATLKANLVPNDDNHFEVEDSKQFFENDHTNYTLQNAKNEGMNLIKALFISIISKHSKCFNHLLTIFNLNNCKLPSLKTKRGNNIVSYSPLHAACRAGNVECVRQLLSRSDVETDETDEEGRTGLIVSSIFNQYEIAKILLNPPNHKKGADPTLLNLNGRGALFMAAYFGNEQIVNLIINTNKVNVNEGDTKGFFPLFVGAQNGHHNIVNILLNNNVCFMNICLCHFLSFHLFC